MRQTHFRPIVLFSVNSKEPRDSMTITTLLNDLQLENQAMVKVENGERKTTWLVLLDEGKQEQQIKDIQAICNVYDQPTLVYSGPDRETKQIAFDGKEEYLGALCLATRREVMTLPSYYARSCGQVGEVEYYTVKNLQ